MATTRLTLIRNIADILGDLTTLTATGGTTTTIVDTVNLYQPDDHFKGQTIYFVSGTAGNVGLIRTITGSTQSTSTITFTPAATGTVTAADVADIYTERGEGWTVQEYRRAIDRAIVDAYPYFLDAATVDGTTAFDATTGTQVIPGTGGTPTTPNLEWLHAVEILDADGRAHNVPRATKRGDPGYYVTLASASITLGRPWDNRADGLYLRYHGHVRPAALSADSSETTIPSEWITAKALSYLLHAGIDRDPSRERLLNLWINREEFLRRQLLGSRSPNGERCREV